jgi:nicotinamidase-related amidase
MEKILVVVDMQNDFIDGSLGTEEARNIVEPVCEKIIEFGGQIFVTQDTHSDNYLETLEGRHLPVEHCIANTEGWLINSFIRNALKSKNYAFIEKEIFGSMKLVDQIARILDKGVKGSIEIVGLCSDICVVSNALMLRSAFPNTEITVDASCCAGVTPDKHKAAMEVMKSCQINVIGE